MSYFYPLLILLLGVRNSSAGNGTYSRDSRTPISLLVLGPYPDIGYVNPVWTGGPALIPAVRLAVDRINNERSDLLPGYFLRLLEGDSGCNILSKTATSLPLLFRVDSEENGNVVGIIGPGCSEAATLIGDIAAKEGVSLIQIGIATSPLLTNTTRFNNTFRMLTSSMQYMELFAKLIEYNRNRNRWEKVAALYDGERQYILSSFRAFVNAVNATHDNPDIIGFSSPMFLNFYFPLNEIKLKYKIIFVFAGSALASNLLCLAYHSEPPLLYPVYQWVFIDRTQEDFIHNVTFIYKEVKYRCSPEQMTKALNGAILTRHSLHREDRVSLVDLSLGEFTDLYGEYLKNYTRELPTKEYSKTGMDYANAYYDATWAFVLSLNETLAMLGPQSLRNYSYGDRITTSVIKTNLKKVNFEGLLGKVSFRGDTQDSYLAINIYQFDGKGEEVLIGKYSNSSLDLNGNETFLTSKFSKRAVSIHPAAAYTFLSLTVLITVFISILHSVYIIYSNKRSIKASSPKLSHLMFSGCYIFILLSGVTTVTFASWIGSDPESHNQRVIAGVICNVVHWMLFIGISLIMGSLCVQLWRIYRIFNHFSSRRFLISDITLTLCVLFLVCINVVILTLWTLLDPMLINYQPYRHGTSEDPQDNSVIVIRAHCSCKHYNIWMMILFGISLMVALCVVVLSSLNRGVKRSHFKTTKSVNVMVYVITILLVLSIGLGFVLERLNIHYKYILQEMSFLGVVFFVCIFLFLPPTLPIFCGLKGDPSLHRKFTGTLKN